jgi:hypothetical protein
MDATPSTSPEAPQWIEIRDGVDPRYHQFANVTYNATERAAMLEDRNMPVEYLGPVLIVAPPVPEPPSRSHHDGFSLEDATLVALGAVALLLSVVALRRRFAARAKQLAAPRRAPLLRSEAGVQTGAHADDGRTTGGLEIAVEVAHERGAAAPLPVWDVMYVEEEAHEEAAAGAVAAGARAVGELPVHDVMYVEDAHEGDVRDGWRDVS